MHPIGNSRPHDHCIIFTDVQLAVPLHPKGERLVCFVGVDFKLHRPEIIPNPLSVLTVVDGPFIQTAVLISSRTAVMVPKDLKNTFRFIDSNTSYKYILI